ncbi:MAG: glycosyltransferase family 2 protein [Deltaproteobacteria bacterium]|jgi:glycosyltransferase involved in cell wall biosynthesis|nr:glycosyltransferase family 2 protein [Deltaproteobacteria bacterium]
MATHNGAKFLSSQLDSIDAQNYKNWQLWISDDCSTDATLSIIQDYTKRWGAEKINLLAGPQKGASTNFLTLTANQTISAEYFAWADQDDIWLPDKLTRAVSKLSLADPQKSALYCGRTILTDEQGRPYGLSPRMNRKPLGFSNALLQCISGGNTMVFNQVARELISDGASLNVFSHDWWAYQIVSAHGGELIYDTEPQVKYRQHGSNQVGSNRGLKARWNRLYRLFNGQYGQNFRMQLKALEKVATKLPADSQKKIKDLSLLCSWPKPFGRLRQFFKGCFYRQSPIEQIIFSVAIFTAKI